MHDSVITTSSDVYGASANYVYIYAETPAQRYERRSNELADVASTMFSLGEWHHAETAAELADAYATIARFAAALGDSGDA